MLHPILKSCNGFDVVLCLTTFHYQDKSNLCELLKKHDFSKFEKLMSVIVLKSWPKNSDGQYVEGEELVMKHLLSWPMAITIFQVQGAYSIHALHCNTYKKEKNTDLPLLHPEPLHSEPCVWVRSYSPPPPHFLSTHNWHFCLLSGANGALINRLTDEAKERMGVASSAFCSVAKKFIYGKIQIQTLNQILERKTEFTQLLKIGDCSGK